ncbi:uncharacterized protein JCM15063_005981 [Sporobolomyces koalae]|uniref:uncharacterized protein n=1 Tax=Sporobolomyces koalae TaxID=500713 RepID=UPI0031824987
MIVGKQDPLVDTLRQLERYLQGDVLAQLAASSLAQTKAALDLAHRGPASQPRSGEEQRSHSSMGGWWLQSEETGYTEANQREVWRNAAMLLSADEDERPSPDEKNGESSTSPGHSHDTSINSAFGDDEAWLEIDSLVKVPILSLRVRTVETTLAAVQAGGTSFGLSFAPDLFEGTRLFGRETIDLTPADLKLVEQLGGTFDITATRKSLPRLERILETLAFTVICLLLEAVLLDELSCPRHTPSPSSSPREADCVPSLAPVEPAEGDPDLSITNLDLPGAYKFDEDEPDDDWAHTKRSWRSSFSNGGVLAWMRLVNPRAQLPQAFKPNRALRRSSTVSSNGQSPVTIRTTSSGQDSPTTSPGTSPAHSPSSDRKRSRVSGKLRGLRDQLRGKISHSRPDVASTELPESLGSPRTLQRQKIPGDVGALGLQIVGLSLKPASWQSPWSTNGNRHRADSDTFVLKDNGSTTGTEVTLEEENQPPKRFEKVIEDLSKFILSTSPDVLYPPPHLLFRLRQQELEASLVPPSPSPSQLPSTPPSPSPLLDEAEKAECLVPGYFSSMRPSALQRAHALPSSHSLALNFAGGFAHERDKVSLAAEEKRTMDPDVIPSEIEDQASNSADAVGTLLNEISSFFESLQVYVDSLYVRLTKNAIPSPSVNADETSTEDDGGRQHIRSDSERTIIDSTTRPSSPTNPIERALQEEQLEQDDLAQLRLLRTFIEGQRRVCLRHADQTLSQELNMSRSTFYTTATALKVRMSAWEKKHMKALGEEETLASPAFVEPNYFREGVIALPIGSNVLLRPGELSSVLAVALSTPEFKEESRSPSAASSRRVTPSTPSFVPKSRQSSLLRLPIPTFIEPEATPQALDADDMSANFSSVQRFELVAKSKKPPRGTASVFQKLVRKKSGEMTGPSTPTSEHGSFTLDSKKRVVKDTVLNDFLKTKDAPSTLPRSPRAVPSIISGLASRREGSSATTLSLNDDVLAHFTPSVSAAGTIRSKIVPSSLDSTASSNSSSISEVKLEEGSIAGTSNTADHDDGEDQLAPLATELGSNSSRLFDGLRHGLDSLRSRSGSASPKLGAGLADEHCYISEHIKLKISHGESKHSVTAYFAGRFKDLRAKCGLSESLFIESLSRCSDLNPSGGKSSAAFLMTGNQRFMLKELVTKFGYSELESLLTFAPRLLDYQMQADRPSLLSKIFGIYTIKIENLETGEKRKLDMIVMDNLFHSQTISRQFDLKGIASRVAKPKPGEKVKEGSTGWDSDWLEGSVRNQLLLYPHSRRLLLDSVANDVEFLSSNGNIDFSLLVGVDDAQCTLVVGLIDTLGVFNTLKVIEHSAKKALAADAASVTVCPPTEYAKRFLASMETYFVAVPDKWSKPPIGSGQEMDPDPRLPCPL